MSETRNRAADIELVVSDDSSDPDVATAVHEACQGWPGTLRYTHNDPPLGLVANFNRCVDMAVGRYVLMLHDDDFLLPSGLGAVLAAIDHAEERDHVLLFGVHVVDGEGALIRRQEPFADRYLAPAVALRRLLAESSFVRFPAVIVRRDAYAAVGPFDAEIGGPADFEMWTRLFGKFGVRWIPTAVSAYTVHEGALTTGMFTAETVRTLMRVFERVARMQVLSPSVIRRSQADWFHQFILGGTYRRLRVGDRAGAADVYRLFDLPEVRQIGRSIRWMPVRLAVSTLVHLPRRLSSSIVRIISLGLSRTNRLPLLGQ